MIEEKIDKIIQFYNDGNFTIKAKRNIEIHSNFDYKKEAINYLLYLFLDNNNDSRKTQLFDYYLKPHTTIYVADISFIEIFEYLLTIK